MAAYFRSNVELLIVVALSTGFVLILSVIRLMMQPAGASLKPLSWFAISSALTMVLVASRSFAGDVQSISQTTLCRGEEQIFFSCPVAASAKIVSHCGAKIIDTRRSYVQYRFGRVGALELQYPRERANTQRAFRYAHYFRSKMDRTEIIFDNQDFRYVVFDYYEGDARPGIKEAGVRVTRHRREQETVLKYSGNPISRLGNLESIVPRDMDNPLNR